MIEKHTKIITKSNSLINSCYSFSLLEQQIILYVVSRVNPFYENFPLQHVIYIKDFIKIFNKKRKAIYKDIEIAISNRFWDREIYYWDYSRDGYRKLRWLVEVFYSNKNGFFEITFSHLIKPFLYQLTQHFTSYNLEDISKFRSIYSIRIYEFCICDINQNKTNTSFLLVAINTIKERLQLEKKYSDFYDFKRFVLQKAKQEINEHSDLNIDFEEIRKGRKVDAIKFIVERKPNTKPASYAGCYKKGNAERLAYESSKRVCQQYKPKLCSPALSKQNISNSNKEINKVTVTVDAEAPVAYNQNENVSKNDIQEPSDQSVSNQNSELNGDLICHGKTAIDTGSRNDLTLYNSNQNSAMTKKETLPQGDETNLKRDNINNLPQANEPAKHEHTKSQKLAIKEMLIFGLSRENAIKFVSDYGNIAVMNTVDKVKKEIAKSNKIKNMGGYFRTTLDNTQLPVDDEQYKDLLEAEKEAEAQQVIDEEVLKFQIAESLKK